MSAERPVLLFACIGVPEDRWAEALAASAPGLELRFWPDAGAAEEIDYVLAWNLPNGFLGQFPHLRIIFSLGAGVERLLADPDLPAAPLIRMVDPSLAAAMNEFVLMRVLHYHRRMPEFEALQRQPLWRQLEAPLAKDRGVGIMGLGQLGLVCAQSLAALGFAVRGWSRTAKEAKGVATFAGEGQLTAFLAGSEILVCLLPLTPDTRGILNAANFDHLPRGAALINVARGGHLVEADLIPALDAGALSHATLDVFAHEPLPADHPFWRDGRITVIPHAAALTEPTTAAPRIAENIVRDRAGQPQLWVVDRESGY